MTQIVRWLARGLGALKGPSERELTPEIQVAIGDAKRINEVIAPPIEEYLSSRGYNHIMVGCGWYKDKLGVVVTLSRPPKKDEIVDIANMATPFPLAIEVEPRLREACNEIIEAALALGLPVQVISVPRDPSAPVLQERGELPLLPHGELEKLD